MIARFLAVAALLLGAFAAASARAAALPIAHGPSSALIGEDGSVAGASAPAVASAQPRIPSPPAAERAASRAACVPFRSAGRQPKGHDRWDAPPRLVIDRTRHYQLKIYTDKGRITVDLLPRVAPITANNFIFLACNGFYDGVVFHRIIPGFVIQGGDPTGTGTGGPGYQFQDEKVPRPYQIGDLAMANAGPNTNGSQFFVVQGPQAASLPRLYTLFGHVTAGESVVDAIANAPAHMMAGGIDSTPSAPNHPVHMRAITLRVS